jgi:hypothetical protein
MVGENNPRVFARTITLDAWRSPFDGKRGEADLHVDIVFGKRGAVGGDGAPVRFRLSLKRAEIHVIRDSEKIIDIKRSSIKRPHIPSSGKRTKKTTKDTTLEGRAGFTISPQNIDLSAKGSAKTRLAITETVTETNSSYPFHVTHWPTESGCSFIIEPSEGSPLAGSPWDARESIMKIRDSNHKRKNGEPPEVRIEIRCLREDFIIEDVAFTDSIFPAWAQLSRLKQVAVEQYIRDELARAGFYCGDLTEPFTEIILADAVPSVER